ncbi:MAG: nucleotidyltransferase domain-containing protein [Flavobacteriales bacterium]|nr:MAG: nucleotidyltransferase domain-containing protein [Flavobacteriales bacterium]
MLHTTLERSATPTVESTVLSCAERAIIRALIYFDLFKHPLRRDEIMAFSSLHEGPSGDLDRALVNLLTKGLVAEADGHYALSRTGELASRRMCFSERAQSRMAKAHRNSKLIGSFPFVRAVMLSGSISKGVLDEQGDIDYFIITAPRRLWVARTLLVLYKKLFLLNSRRDFCVNYFIDTDHVAIEDRNIFTATEVVTLIPTYGPDVCREFFDANGWAFERFPNMPRERNLPHHAPPRQRQVISERLLCGSLGEWLDDAFMRLTYIRWKRKFSGMDARNFEHALRTRKYVSKHHPQGFQQRVLKALQERIRQFEREHGLSLA